MEHQDWTLTVNDLADDIGHALRTSEPYLTSSEQVRAVWKALYVYAIKLDGEAQQASYDDIMEAANTLQPIVEVY